MCGRVACVDFIRPFGMDLLCIAGSLGDLEPRSWGRVSTSFEEFESGNSITIYKSKYDGAHLDSRCVFAILACFCFQIRPRKGPYHEPTVFIQPLMDVGL